MGGRCGRRLSNAILPWSSLRGRLAKHGLQTTGLQRTEKEKSCVRIVITRGMRERRVKCWRVISNNEFEISAILYVCCLCLAQFQKVWMQSFGLVMVKFYALL